MSRYTEDDLVTQAMSVAGVIRATVDNRDYITLFAKRRPAPEDEKNVCWFKVSMLKVDPQAFDDLKLIEAESKKLGIEEPRLEVTYYLDDAGGKKTQPVVVSARLLQPKPTTPVTGKPLSSDLPNKPA
ncbi:hypothetical protein LX59_01583 [Azomonas agilis]|uniref:Uncharacterized protein n=1 Tax=Azomonas agilis TaxID=116849 RepID=A0A562IK28_9GAMM|nr:hypothetical protein [Azomonas agilis]TWH71300.1 hypothetical protein LX59_01583 [Azomonas agilis]